MKSRMTRDYWINENKWVFKASNDDKNFSTNDDRNFSINAQALAVAELTSSSKSHKFERFEDSIHWQTKQNNLEEFDDNEMTMQSTTSFNYDRQMTNLTKVYIIEMKYERLNDSFHYKLIIYHDTCRRVEVSNEVKTLSFSTMLKNNVLKYHYMQMSRIEANITFEIMCKKMTD